MNQFDPKTTGNIVVKANLLVSEISLASRNIKLSCNNNKTCYGFKIIPPCCMNLASRVLIDINKKLLAYTTIFVLFLHELS